MKKNKYRLGIFKDKEDIEISLTNDDVINITGIMGSGKTTLAREIKKQTNYELVSLDWMFGASLKNRPEYIYDILVSFFNTHPKISCKKKYYEYANEIYDYLLKTITNPVIFEGRHIYRYISPNILKGKIIIKRTSLINSYKRAFKRDMNNKIKEYKNNEIKINNVLSRFFERLKFPIVDYIIINKYIIKLVKLSSN